MTKQIQPIDTSVNTWGDVISRVNEVIDAANTDFVTLDATNNGSISITGTFGANAVNSTTATINNIDAETITANSANLQSATVANVNITTVTANTATVNTLNANNVAANVANVAVANVGTLSANLATVTNLTVNTISSFSANVATVSALTSNVANITIINSNTVTANLVYTSSIRVNGRQNIDKLSAADFPPNHALTTDVSGNIIYQPVTNFGRAFMGTTSAETARLQLAIERINNTSDAEKPISTLTQAALDLKVNSATRVTAGTGLAGGGALTANVTLNLSANSIASLAKADSAIQANSTALVPSGGITGQILQKNSSDPYDFSWATSALTTAIQFIPQSLSVEEQAQARENLGLGTALSDYVRRDGTADMTGLLTLSGNPTANNHAANKAYADLKLALTGGTLTGELSTNAVDSFRMTYGQDKSVFSRFDGNSYYLMISDTPTGTFNALRPFSVNVTSGRVTIGNGLTVNGDIAVGTSGQIASDGNIKGTRWGGAWLYDYLNSGSTNLGARAYPRRSDGGAMNFYWSGQGGQPSWLWGSGDGVNMYVYNPQNFNVNYAASAGNASTVGGWSQGTIADQINWRVSDTRFAGYIEKTTTGTVGVWYQFDGGYVCTGYRFTSSAMGTAVNGLATRQPQIHIPNVGWRSLGGW